MKKNYIAPKMVSAELDSMDCLMAVSSDGEGNLTGMSLDLTEENQGGDQMTKRQNLWDSLW